MIFWPLSTVSNLDPSVLPSPISDFATTTAAAPPDPHAPTFVIAIGEAIMDIFVVTASHFAQASAVTSYHTTGREAHIAATERVNSLRADLDPEALPPVNVDNWREGLDEAVSHRLAGLSVVISKIGHEVRPAAADSHVALEKLQAHGLLARAVAPRDQAHLLPPRA